MRSINVVLILIFFTVTFINASSFSFNSPQVIPQSVISRPNVYWNPQDWWFMSVNSVDWDGDGDEDLLCGVKDYNMESYTSVGSRIVYFENVGTGSSPQFNYSGFLKAGGVEINVQNS